MPVQYRLWIGMRYHAVRESATIRADNKMNNIAYRLSLDCPRDPISGSAVLRVERVDMNNGQIDSVVIGTWPVEQLPTMLDRAIRELMHPDEDSVPSHLTMVLLNEKTEHA